MMAIKFEIKHRFTGAVIFTADIEATAETPFSIQLGLAVRKAVGSGANLSRAYLSRADLSGAYLSRAYLSGATGFAPERSTPLLMLLDQPGPIRAYKLVTADYMSPIQSTGRIKYEIGKVVEVADADTNVSEHCSAGVNVATLDWVLKEWKPGWRVLVVEFTAADIAAIPAATDGKFRLHRCTVVAEKTIDPIALGLVKADAAQVAA